MTDAPGGESEIAFERERWERWSDLERRKSDLAEREQANRDLELELRRQEQLRTRWSSPLVVAILAAAVAGMSNAAVTMVNGLVQDKIEREKAEKTRNLEEAKAEATRILEMIKTGNPELAAKNLEFLVQTGLIIDDRRVSQLKTYLASRTPGSGPSLPAPSGATTDRKIVLHPPDPEVMEQLIQNLKGQEKQWMDIAIKEIGVAPPDRIGEYFNTTTLGQQQHSESLPWQSPFVNWVMVTAKYKGTNSALSRSWLNWGKESERRIGAIVIFQRPATATTGVGFYVDENKDKHEIVVLSGNLYGQVTIASFPESTLLGVRWPVGK